MRLLVGYLVVLVFLIGAQSMHPDCSMTNMIGVEWLQCLTR